jgi:hypothetical protein
MHENAITDQEGAKVRGVCPQQLPIFVSTARRQPPPFTRAARVGAALAAGTGTALVGLEHAAAGAALLTVAVAAVVLERVLRR